MLAAASNRPATAETDADAEESFNPSKTETRVSFIGGSQTVKTTTTLPDIDSHRRSLQMAFSQSQYYPSRIVNKGVKLRKRSNSTGHDSPIVEEDEDEDENETSKGVLIIAQLNDRKRQTQELQRKLKLNRIQEAEEDDVELRPRSSRRRNTFTNAQAKEVKRRYFEAKQKYKSEYFPE